MKQLIKNSLQNIFSLLGIEVSRTGKGLLGKIAPITEYPVTENGYLLKCHPSEKDRDKWIQELNIKTVIDIGGYVGDFAFKMHQLLPEAKIYAFEPLRDTFEKLTATLAKIPNAKAYNFAMGEAKGKTVIYRNAFNPCSSLLEVGSNLKEQLPFTQDTYPETIEIETLDNMAQELDLQENIFLKVDVQGFEDKVILGGMNTLAKVKLISIETSFQELYVGQALFGDIYKLLVDRLGFTYLGSETQQKSPSNGYPFQEDSWFIKL